MLVLFLLLVFQGKVWHFLLDELLHDWDDRMTLVDILRTGALSAFGGKFIFYLFFVPSETFETLVGFLFGFCDLVMDWIVDTQISEIWKLSTDASRQLLKGDNVYFVCRALALDLFFAKI